MGKETAGTTPDRQGLILLALVLGAGVANMNLAVANVGLPFFGRDLDASQTSLNSVAAGLVFSDRRALVLLAISLVAGIALFVRQWWAESPLFDLRYAARPTFWVSAVAGIIVFGSLMGAVYVGEQFLQNVLGYNAFEAGSTIVPCAVFMVAAAPFSSRLIKRFGSRITLLMGFAACMFGFLTMFVWWST